jgi:exodeoxyribonuclease VII small subunit
MPDETRATNATNATKTNKTDSVSESALSFEAGLQQLEAIVKEMESGELPLERALDLFERGMKLSDSCRKQLEQAETRVEILMKRAGELQPEPFRAGNS